jgi:hypothetical protein
MEIPAKERCPPTLLKIGYRLTVLGLKLRDWLPGISLAETARMMNNRS